MDHIIFARRHSGICGCRCFGGVFGWPSSWCSSRRLGRIFGRPSSWTLCFCFEGLSGLWFTRGKLGWVKRYLTVSAWPVSWRCGRPVVPIVIVRTRSRQSRWLTRPITGRWWCPGAPERIKLCRRESLGTIATALPQIKLVTCFAVWITLCIIVESRTHTTLKDKDRILKLVLGLV